MNLLAALYDIHGNLPALEAVLADVRRARVDRVVIGGDVLPGPMPRETLAALRNLDVPTAFIRGNGDRETLSFRAGQTSTGVPAAFHDVLRWVACELDDNLARFIVSWPPTRQFDVPGLGAVLFCHATPRNDTDIFTRLTPEDRLRPLFDGLGVSLVVCGHTHMPFDRTIGGTRVVNAGSVGMPFGRPGADWLLLGPGVELRHTDYDLAGAAERVRKTPYPQADSFASQSIERPPSEAVMLERFARAELQ